MVAVEQQLPLAEAHPVPGYERCRRARGGTGVHGPAGPLRLTNVPLAEPPSLTSTFHPESVSRAWTREVLCSSSRSTSGRAAPASTSGAGSGSRPMT